MEAVQQALETFRRMVPPQLPPGWKRGDPILENPFIGALKQGVSINRTDFSIHAYHDCMVRSMPYRRGRVR